jgi:hypothetical protein
MTDLKNATLLTQIFFCSLKEQHGAHAKLLFCSEFDNYNSWITGAGITTFCMMTDYKNCKKNALNIVYNGYMVLDHRCLQVNN